MFKDWWIIVKGSHNIGVNQEVLECGLKCTDTLYTCSRNTEQDVRDRGMLTWRPLPCSAPPFYKLSFPFFETLKMRRKHFYYADGFGSDCLDCCDNCQNHYDGFDHPRYKIQREIHRRWWRVGGQTWEKYKVETFWKRGNRIYK